MKVNRHDSKEKSKVTAPWLYEFAYDLEKGAYNNVDYLKDYFDSRTKKKFSSIDEKMADIKERVGFDLARKISEEINKDDKLTASQDLEASNIKQAEHKHKHSDRDIKLMENILKYVKDMIRHEPHLDRAAVVARCKDETDLGLDKLRINFGVFHNWIDKKLEKANDKEPELVSYVPNEPLGEGDADDYRAEYYSHAEPSPA